MNKIETTATYTIPTDAVVVGLCAGRHDMPVEEFIFPQVVDPPRLPFWAGFLGRPVCVSDVR